MGTTIRDNPKMLSNQRLELVTTFFSLTKKRESSLTNLTSAAYLSLALERSAPTAALRETACAVRRGSEGCLAERDRLCETGTIPSVAAI